MRKLLAHTVLALVWSLEALIMVVVLAEVLPAIVDEQPNGAYDNLEWWV